jgi:hypothetical protein
MLEKSIEREIMRQNMEIALPLILCTGLLFFCQGADSTKDRTATAPKVPATSQQVSPPPAATGATTPGDTAVSPKQTQQKTIVYYFHGTYRCPSCNLIENLTKQAVESGFKAELADGRVELKVINIETAGNEHFEKDYKLYTKSVIFSNIKDGKEDSWKNLDQIWTLLRDQSKFIEYIQTELTACVKGKCL